MAGCFVLNFHGIGDPPPGAPADEAETWLELDRFRGVLDRVRDESRIRLTFDDGYESDRIVALEELQRRGLTATFFLAVAHIGAPGRLTTEDVRALAGAGMEIGSHGMDHVPWRRLGADRLATEVGRSRSMLAEIAGTTIQAAACPFGAYDRRVLKALRRAGYRRVFTSDGGPARPTAWLQARTSLRSSDDVGTIDRLLRVRPHDRARYFAARAVKSIR